MPPLSDTNHFLIGSEACWEGGTYARHWKPSQKPITEELTGSREQSDADVLINGLVSISICTHRLALPSALVREVSLCSRKWLKQRTLVKVLSRKTKNPVNDC